MSAHQRPAVVTVIAVLMHLLARYRSVQRREADSWRAAWDDAIGDEALRLVARHDEVAFLQPPTGEPTSSQSLEAADLLLPNIEHEVKRSWSTTAERAVLAIMSSLLRPNVKDHRSSTRTGLTVVLASDDGSLGSEIDKVVAALDALFGATPGEDLAQHLIWMRPYRPGSDKPIPFGQLPRPFLDVGRALRIVDIGHGRFGVAACPNNSIRVEGRDPWIDDPHAPKLISAAGVQRYKLAAKNFGPQFQHGVLFGGITKLGEEITRPRIMDLTMYRIARLCSLGSDQGKTLGYWEAMFVATRSKGLFSLEPPTPQDRPARLSERALQTLAVGGKILYAALAELHREGDDLNDTDKRRIDAASSHYRAVAGPASVQVVFDLLNDAEDPTS
jgi:hypothetical protein